MPRLNAEVRYDIVNAAIKHAFAVKIEALRADHEALALAIYNACYPPAVQKRMNDLPKSWLPTRSILTIRVGSDDHQFMLSGSEARYGGRGEFPDFHIKDAKDVYKRVPYGDHSGTIKVFDHNHEIAEPIAKFVQKRQVLYDELCAARNKTAATVNTFYTSEKLVEAWPEIAPFIPANMKPTVQLPAVPTADLNAMLGLPVTAGV